MPRINCTVRVPGTVCSLYRTGIPPFLPSEILPKTSLPHLSSPLLHIGTMAAPLLRQGARHTVFVLSSKELPATRARALASSRPSHPGFHDSWIRQCNPQIASSPSSHRFSQASATLHCDSALHGRVGGLRLQFEGK